MDILIKFDDAVTMIAKAVGERGADHVYLRECNSPSCRYIHGVYDADGMAQVADPKPVAGCIVGLGLVLGGYLTVHQLAVLGNHGTIGGEYRVTLRDAGITFTERAMSFLSTLQHAQDDQDTWGSALHRSLRYAYTDGAGDDTRDGFLVEDDEDDDDGE